LGSLRLSSHQIHQIHPRDTEYGLCHSFETLYPSTDFVPCELEAGARQPCPHPSPSPPRSGFISRSISARTSRHHTCSCASSLLPIFQLQPFSVLFFALIPRSLPSIYLALIGFRHSKPLFGK
jgi:hypothetical protein